MKLKRGIVREGRGGQVRLDDTEEGMASPWIDVPTEETSGGRTFSRPRPGNLAYYLTDEHGERGVLLGSVYSDADPAPIDADDIFYRQFGDGSVLLYDEGAGVLSFRHAGGLSFELDGSRLSFKGDIEIDGDLTVLGKTKLDQTEIEGTRQVGS